MAPENVLILPGWQSSDAGHWQTLWEAQHGYRRVQQHDWLQPLRGDWSARLNEVVGDCTGEVLLVAHSLGCILTAWWAAHSPHTGKVRGAMLVAPGNVEGAELSVQLPGWAPIARQTLPFPTVLVASRNDPYCGFEQAKRLAHGWGARFVDAGERGHINADSGLGDWPEGQALLQTLMKD